MERIPVSGPSITQKEVDYVSDAARRCWYAEANYYHERFERAFADYVGMKHAVALPSCTSAIHLALAALGVGPGDEVVVPDVTWIASAAPISYVGATPVFADIDPQSWCLSAESFKQSITPRTKAVIPVDLYGNLPEMHRIRAVAHSHGIAVIEDAAEAIGSEYHGRRAGGLADIGVFSFHGSKTMTTGEGGMLVTSNDTILERVQKLRDHGRAPGDKMFWNSEVGFKYKMSSMQAALGLAQLERIDELVARKRTIFGWYREALADFGEVTLNHEALGTKNTYWMVTAILDSSLNCPKESVIQQLGAMGIDCRPMFYPLSSLPAYEHLSQARVARSRNHISYELSPWGVNLPSGLNLTQSQVEQVASALQQVATGRGTRSKLALAAA
jgi:perosamine synthetase